MKGKKQGTGNIHFSPYCILINSVCCDVLCCAQLCLVLCDPIDCSPPGSSIRGIFPARIPEWVAMPSSKGYSQPRNPLQYCLENSIRGAWWPIVQEVAKSWTWLLTWLMTWTWMTNIFSFHILHKNIKGETAENWETLLKIPDEDASHLDHPILTTTWRHWKAEK